jgi:hypothetical protein
MNERDEASYKAFLEDKVAQLEAQVKSLQEQIKQLQREKGISSAREGLTFNGHSGLWADQAGQLYCPKCLNSDKRNPLKTEQWGWRCTAAGHFFGNDRRPEVRLEPDY